MGQGLRPKKKKTSIEATVKPIISASGEITDGNPTLMNCFQFQLEEPTRLVKKVDVGTTVFGDFSTDRIIIVGQIGSLGYVPKNITKKIISIAESKQSSIQGTNIEKIADENVVVEICL